MFATVRATSANPEGSCGLAVNETIIGTYAFKHTIFVVFVQNTTWGMQETIKIYEERNFAVKNPDENDTSARRKNTL